MVISRFSVTIGGLHRSLMTAYKGTISSIFTGLKLDIHRVEAPYEEGVSLKQKKDFV